MLRGVFLLRRKELDFFYEGHGTNFLFPEQWEAYKVAVLARSLSRAPSRTLRLSRSLTLNRHAVTAAADGSSSPLKSVAPSTVGPAKRP